MRVDISNHPSRRAQIFRTAFQRATRSEASLRGHNFGRAAHASVCEMQTDRADACSDVEPLVARNAEWLQREGLVKAAD